MRHEPRLEIVKALWLNIDLRHSVTLSFPVKILVIVPS